MLARARRVARVAAADLREPRVHPAWSTLRQIDSLLEIIDESYREGLEPNDYHVEALRAVRATLADPVALAPRERAELRYLADRQHHPARLSPAVRQGRSERDRSELERRRRELVPRGPCRLDPSGHRFAVAARVRGASDSAPLSLRALQERARRVSGARGERRLALRAGRRDAEAGRHRRARAGARRAPHCHGRAAGLGRRRRNVLRLRAFDGRPEVSSAPRACARRRRRSGHARGAQRAGRGAHRAAARESRARSLGVLRPRRASFWSPTSRDFSSITCAAARSSGARACRWGGRTGRRRSSAPR